MRALRAAREAMRAGPGKQCWLGDECRRAEAARRCYNLMNGGAPGICQEIAVYER